MIDAFLGLPSTAFIGSLSTKYGLMRDFALKNTVAGTNEKYACELLAFGGKEDEHVRHLRYSPMEFSSLSGLVS